MSHMSSQFITPNYIGAQVLTPEQLVVQSELMYAAVLKCVELDHVVGYEELVEHIDLYLTTHGDDVSVRVLEEYLVSRGAKMWVEEGTLQQVCLH